MSGTRQGGVKARNTHKARYGDDYYAKIGAMGGKKGRTGGFYANRELARTAGAKGGRISRRTPGDSLRKLQSQPIIATTEAQPLLKRTFLQRLFKRRIA